MSLSCFTYKIATCLVFSAVLQYKSHHASAQHKACYWLFIALRMKLECTSCPVRLRMNWFWCVCWVSPLVTLWSAQYHPIIVTSFPFFENTFSQHHGFSILFPLPRTVLLSIVYCLSPIYPSQLWLTVTFWGLTNLQCKQWPFFLIALCFSPSQVSWVKTFIHLRVFG